MGDEAKAKVRWRDLSRAQKRAVWFWLLVIAAAVADMIYEGRRADSAGNWPTAIGRVVDSGLTVGGGGGRGAGQTIYTPHVRYAYRVGGRAFTAERIWIGSGIFYDDIDEAHEFMRPYDEGAEVTVHYNPADPADAALVTEDLGPMMLLFVFVGAVAIYITWNWGRFIAWNRRYNARYEAKAAARRQAAAAPDERA